MKWLRSLILWLNLTTLIVAVGLWAFDVQRLGAGLFLALIVLFVLWVLMLIPKSRPEWERGRASWMWGDQ